MSRTKARRTASKGRTGRLGSGRAILADRMGQHSTCLSPFCGYRADRYLPTCPECGRPMHPDDEIAGRGCHLMWLGFILAGLMGGVAWALGPGLIDALGGSATKDVKASPLRQG